MSPGPTGFDRWHRYCVVVDDDDDDDDVYDAAAADWAPVGRNDVSSPRCTCT